MKSPQSSYQENNKDLAELRLGLEARLQRHRRVFPGGIFFSRTLFRLILDLKIIMRKLSGFFGSMGIQKWSIIKPVNIQNPYRQFLRQAIVIGSSILIVTSIVPNGLLATGFTADSYPEDLGTDYIEESDVTYDNPSLLINSEGFVLKYDAPSDEQDSVEFTDSLVHTVAGGDTLSSIAALYGINVDTLKWENNLDENDVLKVGQQLVVLSKIGVNHKIAKGDTCETIAKTYGVQSVASCANESLVIGARLFVPDGKRKDAPIIVRSGIRGGDRSVSGGGYIPKVAFSSEGGSGTTCAFPTDTGSKFTQGFTRGHYAVDIANSGRPDVYACDAGVVVLAKTGCKARSGGCNGGYGNYIVIDHGKGFQTLYGHGGSLYVTEGQKVSRGQAIMQMSNTGRVRGKTGIHVHMETIVNGAKKNPMNYLRKG